MTIKNAIKLIQDIEKKQNNWDERSQFTIKGVRNLSPSDLDTLKLYADHFINSGGVSFNGLMNPLGEVGDVLKAYNIKSMY